MKALIAAIPLVLLAACHTTGSSPAVVDDDCGAARRQNLVGTPVSKLDRSSLPELSRVLHPTTPMTRDYRTDRLNVYVDEAGIISRVSCG